MSIRGILSEQPLRHLFPSVRLLLKVTVVTALMVFAGGCTTTQKGMAQFDPAPREEVGAVELEPVTPKAVADLLREAEKELAQANLAHEEGRPSDAAVHYRRMIELLIEAELHPALHYATREKFNEILENYLRHAHLYHHPERQIGMTHSDCYNDLVIPYPLPQPVLDEIDELRHSYTNTFQRGLNRSTRYMPHLQNMFREAGLPEDLAWLAMVESMFQPKVVSPAGAGGMWQFMRATARRYDLRMDSHVDERYNWHSATRAAIEYLKTLHDYFDGDWALAITAYNMGEGGLGRAIASNNGQRDFWELINTPPASDRIKQESKKFYPRLMAYIIVANAPQEYGFAFEPEPFEDVLRIPVSGSYALSDLDAAMGLQRGTLARLNPDLLREVTPGQGEYAVAVPREQRDVFLAALSTVRSTRMASTSNVGSGGDSFSGGGGGTHRVRRGETISQIAQRHKVCPQELMRHNRIRSARLLQANQVLQIPDSGQGKGGGGVSAAAPEPPQANTQSRTADVPVPRNPALVDAVKYTVKRGDTLFDIARAHNVTVAQLQAWNDLSGRAHIQVGQALKVGETPVQPRGDVKHHEVKPGEYPGIIAQLYGIPVSDLLRWNNLTERSVIRSGDRLVVASDAAPAQDVRAAASNATPNASTKPVSHKVAPGETAGTIAKRYGVRTADLLAWNQLTAKSIIRVNQELIVKNPSSGGAQRDRGDDIQLSQASETRKVVHKVTQGQNPTTIARQYGVKVNDLFKWNNWSERHVLRVGDEVEIYRD